MARRRGYLEWTEDVVQGCRGANPALESYYDGSCKRAALRLRPKPRLQPTGQEWRRASVRERTPVAAAKEA